MATPVDPEQQRLVTKAALLYHHHGMKQTEIARRFGISQPQVSRLLELAHAMRIVRTSVIVPDGLYAELEGALESKYGLRDAHVTDVSDHHNDESVTADLGRALAHRLPAMLAGANSVGFTSWSRSLRAAVSDLLPIPDSTVTTVVELLGDVGEPALQHQAAQSTLTLANLLDAEPKFLRVPGVATSVAMRDGLLMHDAYAQEVLGMLNSLDVALSGVAGCNATGALGPGDNFFTDEQFAFARSLGAVGQVNLRFIAADGSPVRSELDSLVIGITLEQLLRTPMRVGVAGGAEKRESLRAALRGGWLNVLVTDVESAEWLLAHADD